MDIVSRLLAIVPVLVLLGWGGTMAVEVIRSDSLVREASLEMATWAAARVDPDVGTWSSVRDKVRAGIALRSDPSSHELLGLLGTMRRDDAQAMLDGRAHFLKALEMRPTSPYTWANLVEADYHAGAAAGRLELALRRATELGPSEPGVQRLVADYGLAVWPALSAEARAAVDRMVAAGMRRKPLEMLRISERRGRLEVACRHVFDAEERDPRIGRACERWEITP